MSKIGVVILNYKTYRDTERLVRDLLLIEDGNEYFIVVVDNLSPNDSYDHIFRAFSGEKNVYVIQSGENKGYAYGNNVGLRFLERFDPDYILILNNDVYFESDLIQKCIDRYEHLPDVGAISPVQYRPDGSVERIASLRCSSFIGDLLKYSLLYRKFSKNHLYYPNCSIGNVQAIDIVPGCFIFISFLKFKEIGYFYEGTFLFGEERFLHQRLKDRGYQNYIILDEKYIHDHSHTINSEVAKNTQLKLLNDGYCEYTKVYRKFPAIKIALLRLALKTFKFEMKLLAKLKSRR